MFCGFLQLFTEGLDGVWSTLRYLITAVCTFVAERVIYAYTVSLLPVWDGVYSTVATGRPLAK